MYSSPLPLPYLKIYFLNKLFFYASVTVKSHAGKPPLPNTRLTDTQCAGDWGKRQEGEGEGGLTAS